MRLFVGLSFSENIRRSLGCLLSGLDNARWVKPENFHLTLRFIGDVNSRDAADLDSILASIYGETFNLELAGLGYFGKNDKLRTLWVDIVPNKPLLRLHKKVERGVISAGFGAKVRKFKPHVTLAQFGGRKPRDFDSYFFANGAFSMAPFKVSSFTLFESYLGRGGSHYVTLAEYPLHAPETRA